MEKKIFPNTFCSLHFDPQEIIEALKAYYNKDSEIVGMPNYDEFGAPHLTLDLTGDKSSEKYKPKFVFTWSPEYLNR